MDISVVPRSRFDSLSYVHGYCKELLTREKPRVNGSAGFRLRRYRHEARASQHVGSTEGISPNLYILASRRSGAVYTYGEPLYRRVASLR
jgi:hypothetical protein